MPGCMPKRSYWSWRYRPCSGMRQSSQRSRQGEEIVARLAQDTGRLTSVISRFELDARWPDSEEETDKLRRACGPVCLSVQTAEGLIVETAAGILVQQTDQQE